MIEISNTIVDVKPIEAELKHQQAPRQRLVLIDTLAACYAFTNLARARVLLEEQAAILRDIPMADYELNYYLYMALVENQAYQYDLAEEYFRKAIDLIEELGNLKQQAETYIDFAGTLINNRKMQEASIFLEKAERLLKNYPDDRLRARFICREGFVYLHYANYSKAIELLLEADKMILALPNSSSLKDYYFLVLINSGLGAIFERNDDPQRSVESFLKAVTVAETMGMRSRMSWHYMNVGNSLMNLGKYERAAKYLSKAIQAEDDSSAYPKASAYASLGYCSLKKKRYPEALELLDKAEEIFEKLPDEDYKHYAIIESWRGLIYARLGSFEKAEQYFMRALDWAEIENDYKILSNIFQEMATFYAEKQDFKRAYEYQLWHSQYGEEYLKQVNKRKRMELEVMYASEKKVQEAELARLNATRLQMKALRAQMNPHFLYNALNSIQNYITSNEMAYASKYLAKFAKLMRQSLEYSELEVISLDKEIEFLEDYLYINEKLRFEDNKLKYEIHVDEDIEGDIIGVPTMIVQPYVENAIEHGLNAKKDGLIRLSFSFFDDKNILCIVEDNGIGREKARQRQIADAKYQNHQSRGTKITEERLKLLNADKKDKVFVKTIDLFNEETGEPLGTKVEIKIPIAEVNRK